MTRTRPTPRSRRCKAHTACGLPCRRWVASANGLCASHRGRLWLVQCLTPSSQVANLEGRRSPGSMCLDTLGSMAT